VSGERIGTEVRLLARQPGALTAFGWLQQLGLDEAIHPGFGLHDCGAARDALALLPAGARRDRLLLGLATRGVAPSELPALLERLAFTAADRDVIVATATGAGALARELARAGTPSQIAAAAVRAPDELVAAAGAQGAREQAREWLERLRDVRLEISGDDLLAAGVPRGPAVGRGLRAALAARQARTEYRRSAGSQCRSARHGARNSVRESRLNAITPGCWSGWSRPAANGADKREHVLWAVGVCALSRARGLLVGVGGPRARVGSPLRARVGSPCGRGAGTPCGRRRAPPAGVGGHRAPGRNDAIADQATTLPAPLQPPPPFYRRGPHFAIDLNGAHALFTSRKGGHSTGPYASLNLGRNTDDDPARVRANYAAVAETVGLAPAPCHQVHGTTIHRPTAARGSDLPEADGQLVVDPGLAPMVTVADCLPIVVASSSAAVVLHAGWRGLAGGVVANGVRELGLASGASERLAAAIGPGAGGCCYEVGDEVHAVFAAGYPHARRGRNLDLKAIAREQLERVGVAEVHDLGMCTLCGDPSLFFSHRRDRGVTGRQAGIAWLATNVEGRACPS
jgi:YfiH family protein